MFHSRKKKNPPVVLVLSKTSSIEIAGGSLVVHHTQNPAVHNEQTSCAERNADKGSSAADRNLSSYLMLGNFLLISSTNTGRLWIWFLLMHRVVMLGM